MVKWICLLLFIPSIACADSYLFYGKYINSTLNAYNGANKEYVAARAGIHIETRPIKWFTGNSDPVADNFILFVEDETLMSEVNGLSGIPSTVNYNIGFIIDMGKLDVRYQHECKHPISPNMGIPEVYNLIEVRYKLNVI